MWDFIKGALSGDSTTSSRRLITFIFCIAAMVAVMVGLIMCFKIALTDKASPAAIEAVAKAIQIIIINEVVVLLLVGVITWQNINDTASIIRGIPKTTTEIEGKIKQVTEEVKPEQSNDTGKTE